MGWIYRDLSARGESRAETRDRQPRRIARRWTRVLVSLTTGRTWSHDVVGRRKRLVYVTGAGSGRFDWDITENCR